MKETSILIKPASASCNCVCTYCFYDDVSNCREVKTHGVIQSPTWRKLVDDVFNSNEHYERVNFLFQGGEPLMAGLKFFKQFVAYVKKRQKACEVSYSVQTNGTLLSPSFCEFFKNECFFVGISIDGFRENHNRNRFLHDHGSYDQVMNGLNLLKSYQLEFNVLTVLTKQLAKEPERLYNFYVQENLKHVQIIPCLANFGKDPQDDLYACTPELFGSFYQRFYELWLNDFKNGEAISENFIENVLTILLGGQPTRCGMLGQCESQCIVEANGSLYPCDFYVMDEYELGNINQQPLDKILENPITNTFKVVDQTTFNHCKQCRFEKICHGNCKRMRSSFLNETYCGYQALLETIVARIQELYAYLPKQ